MSIKSREVSDAVRQIVAPLIPRPWRAHDEEKREKVENPSFKARRWVGEAYHS